MRGKAAFIPFKCIGDEYTQNQNKENPFHIHICTKDSIAKGKSGVKFVWKFVHGGGLMAYAILNFHFFGTFP